MPRSSFSQREAALFFSVARRVVRHPALDILLAPAAQPTNPKLVVVTPARIGTAPQRNKVRRRIKALFHELQPVADSYDCAIVVKRQGVSLSFHELCQLILPALTKYKEAYASAPASKP